MTQKELSPRRKKSRERRTKRILRRAMELVKTEGISGLTIHRLARDLDYTVGALYRYFASKDELIATLQSDGMMALLQTLREIRDHCSVWMEESNVPKPLKPLIQLLALGDFYATYAMVGSAHFRLLSVLLGHPEPIMSDKEAMDVLVIAQPIFDDITGYIDEAVALGSLEADDSQDRTLVLWSSLFGLMQLQKISRLVPEWMDYERLLSQLQRTLLQGWGATQDDVGASLAFVKQFESHFSFEALASLDKYSKLTHDTE